MNQQQRNELRENHRRDGVLGCWTCQDYAWNDEYPCDVIRVLDAWEAEKANDFTNEELETILGCIDPSSYYSGFEEVDALYIKAKAILEARDEPVCGDLL